VFRTGDGTLGWRDMAPFDRILITAGAPHLPTFLEEQLRPDGIAVVPVGQSENQSLIKATLTPNGLTRRVLCGCTFVPLIWPRGLGGRRGWLTLPRPR
jgi:protein-L-isoaspartate(D-aspartate) O-methyltransferase